MNNREWANKIVLILGGFSPHCTKPDQLEYEDELNDAETIFDEHEVAVRREVEEIESKEAKPVYPSGPQFTWTRTEIN